MPHLGSILLIPDQSVEIDGCVGRALRRGAALQFLRRPLGDGLVHLRKFQRGSRIDTIHARRNPGRRVRQGKGRIRATSCRERPTIDTALPRRAQDLQGQHDDVLNAMFATRVTTPAGMLANVRLAIGYCEFEEEAADPDGRLVTSRAGLFLLTIALNES